MMKVQLLGGMEGIVGVSVLAGRLILDKSKLVQGTGFSDFFPWVMGTVMVTKPHESWEKQCHTSSYDP